MARLVASGFDDKKLFGLWTLRTALEDQESPDANLPAAAQWVIIAGHTLYTSTDEYPPTGGADVARPGKFFKGNRGFSTSRWEFWEETFAKMAADKDLDLSGETRDWAERAVQAMNQVETS
jgi:hypothetical protein